MRPGARGRSAIPRPDRGFDEHNEFTFAALRGSEPEVVLLAATHDDAYPSCTRCVAEP
jgi:hypothetical protein